jgi:16S rRNA (adenine1518-N6/adenine1519-N6)-dimethyltransferase
MKAKKSFGQNWLRDDATLDEIVEAAELSIKDTVLEVGPGLGTLTSKLVKKAGKVVAVEADQDLIPYLLDQAAKVNNLEIVSGDILKFDLTKLPAGYKVVANIPYYLTSNLIRNLLEASNPPTAMVLLVQKEVAERIVAGPGQMSVLSFSVQYYGEATIVRDVSRELFDPVPQVDSAIIKIMRHTEPVFAADTRLLFRLVKAGFGEKRKMLRNSLSGGLHVDQSAVEELLMAAQISSTARAQELSMQQWKDLYTATKTVLQ